MLQVPNFIDLIEISSSEIIKGKIHLDALKLRAFKSIFKFKHFRFNIEFVNSKSNPNEMYSISDSSNAMNIICVRFIFVKSTKRVKTERISLASRMVERQKVTDTTKRSLSGRINARSIQTNIAVAH